MQLQTARTASSYLYLGKVRKSEERLVDIQLQPLQYRSTYDYIMSPNYQTSDENEEISPIIPLIIEKESDKESEKTKYIQLEIKTKAGRNFPTTYKKFVRRFDEGTPYEFVVLIQDLQEIFLQNKTTQGSNRDSVIQNLLCGESLDTYRASLGDLIVNPEDANQTLVISQQIVKAAMKDVAKTVFPFRALDKQKAWMEREMKKPRELKVRKFLAAVT